jgi:hypothetical protein
MDTDRIPPMHQPLYRKFVRETRSSVRRFLNVGLDEDLIRKVMTKLVVHELRQQPIDPHGDEQLLSYATLAVDEAIGLEQSPPPLEQSA